MRLPRDASRLWQFLYILLTILKPLFCRLRVEGTEHIPATGGCIIASNHSMGPDYILLGYASSRQIFYMAKIELFYIHPWLTKFLNAIGTFPIQRGRNDTEAISAAETLLQQGKVLGMFPEGTRSRTGELQRGKTGAVRIAMKLQTPVVPAVVIHGEKVFKQFRPEVIVRFGPALYPVGDPGDRTPAHTNTEAVMRGIAQLLPPERRGIYGKSRAERLPTPEAAPVEMSVETTD